MTGPSLVDLVISHGYVLTMDDNRHVHTDGAVAINGRDIVAVGPTSAILEQYRAAVGKDWSGWVPRDGSNGDVERLAKFIAAEVPAYEPLIVAGDFNDWGVKLDAPMRALGLHRAGRPGDPPARFNTFPSRLPVFSMDRIYLRGLQCVSTSVPRGAAWARMSDHLPLVAELTLE